MVFFPIILYLGFSVQIPKEVWVAELFLEPVNIAGKNDPLTYSKNNYQFGELSTFPPNTGDSLDYITVRLEKSLPLGWAPQLRKTKRKKALKAWPCEKDASFQPAPFQPNLSLNIIRNSNDPSLNSEGQQSWGQGGSMRNEKDVLFKMSSLIANAQEPCNLYITS